MEQPEVKLLLDTHAWFWWMMGSSRLPAKAANAIGSRQNEAMVSAVSVYELMLKHHIGKLPEMELVARDVERQLDLDGFGRLALTSVHAARAGTLSYTHRDPFDRLLIAQALTDGLTLVSNEALFDGFGVERLWD